jgi:hypothetical protein
MGCTCRLAAVRSAASVLPQMSSLGHHDQRSREHELRQRDDAEQRQVISGNELR